MANGKRKVPAGFTADSVIDRMERMQAMSAKERTEYIRSVTSKVRNVRMSEEDYVMMMAANGYFQNEDGEIE